MDFGPAFDPGIIFAVAVVAFVALYGYLKWPMPIAFLVVAVISAILGGFGIPYRQLVEGEFGFINLAMVLFAGAFFGHMMRVSGAADAAAAGIVKWTGGRPWLVLLLVGAPIFVVGMFCGLSGVAVLSAGAFAVPALRRIGYDDVTAASFMAVIAVSGMIAPPINVPAMLLSDGVNMPWEGVAKALLLLSLPTALVGVAWIAWWGPTQPPAAAMDAPDVTRKAIIGLIPLAIIIAIWLVIRIWGKIFIDPASPLILAIGGLCAIPLLVKFSDVRRAVMSTFTGTPLALAGVLMAVGVVVQIGALTGVQGWLVIKVMTLPYPWNLPSLLIGMPLIGGSLTSIEASDIIGVPAAFSFIAQNMIINVSAISSIGALAEFVPPTSIAAALSLYMVGGGTIRGVWRRVWPPMLVLAAIAILMLVFGKQLTPYLVG
jgi:TRAP-type C4-dicarboxylate transport system permease large subunit